MKPDIVFFGQPLPALFYQNRSIPQDADLCIVMGTSLTVQPFASLPDLCEERVPRLLINLERVGNLGSRPDDVLFLDDCDVGVRKLADALGWTDELESVRRAADICSKEVHPAAESLCNAPSTDLEQQVAELTKEIDESLGISNGYAKILQDQLDR